MMKSLVLLSAIIACVFAQTEQNLCGARTNVADIIFVNDPSACGSYLWCNFDASNVLTDVRQGTCPAGFFFNPTLKACDAQFTCQTDLCLEVGVATEPALRVADAADTTCTEFFFCNTGVKGSTVACNPPLVFNRNFGVCTSADIAPCSGQGGGVVPPPTTCTAPGFFDNSATRQNCADFFICDDANVRTDLSCPTGTYFNPASGGCQDPSVREPTCPFTTTPPQFIDGHIPTPPLVNAPKSLNQQLRNRFAHMFRN